MGRGALCLTRNMMLGARRSPPRNDKRAVVPLSEKAASRFALMADEDARARSSRLRVIQNGPACALARPFVIIRFRNNEGRAFGLSGSNF